MRRVVLRADYGKETGYGHFFRTLALAGYLKDEFKCCFFTFNHDTGGMPSDAHLKMIQKESDFFKVCDSSSFEEFNEEFIRLLQPQDIVVLDNYYFSTAFQKRVKEKGCKLVCIDDMHDRPMVCDILITPSPLRREQFDLEVEAAFRGGIEWAFLREPFLKEPEGKRGHTQAFPSRIVVAMGGSDAFNLTDKMTRTVRKALPQAAIDVVCGVSVTVAQELAGTSGITLHRQLTAEEMAALFDKADIAVLPASTVCIEAFSRHLPVIAGYCVDNQMDFYISGKAREWFAPLGSFRDDEEAIVRRMKDILEHKAIPSPPYINFSAQKKKIVKLFHNL